MCAFLQTVATETYPKVCIDVQFGLKWLSISLITNHFYLLHYTDLKLYMVYLYLLFYSFNIGYLFIHMELRLFLLASGCRFNNTR